MTRHQPDDSEEHGTVIETGGMEDTVVPGVLRPTLEHPRDVVLLLEPYRPHILIEIGLGQELASPFVAFLKEQQGLSFPLPSSLLLHLLETFMRQNTHSEFVPRPTQTAEAILTRAAVRRFIEEENEPDRREFFQTALDRDQVQQLEFASRGR